MHELLPNKDLLVAVRHIVVDEKKLASLGEEERPVTHGTTVLGPEQRALIARCFTLVTGGC